MPTNRNRRSRLHRPVLSAAQIAYLTDTGLGSDDPYAAMELDALRAGYDSAMVGYRSPRELWNDNRETYLAKYILHNPGKRPYAWWQWDAPETRQRIGGIGDPAHEHLAYKPYFEYGLPAGRWVTESDTRNYSDFKGRAPVDGNMPEYESQATYLERLDLLTEAEREYNLDYTPTTLARVTKIHAIPAGAYRGARSEEYQRLEWLNL